MTKTKLEKKSGKICFNISVTLRQATTSRLNPALTSWKVPYAYRYVFTYICMYICSMLHMWRGMIQWNGVNRRGGGQPHKPTDEDLVPSQTTAVEDSAKSNQPSTPTRERTPEHFFMDLEQKTYSGVTPLKLVPSSVEPNSKVSEREL